MIDFLEVRDKTRKLIGVIDTAKSIIWQTDYYGAGAFEIYIGFTEQAKNLLQIGYYLTRRDEKNAAIIESVESTDSARDGLTILVKGRMLKSILDRRIVYNFLTPYKLSPIRISGNVAVAVTGVVKNHAGVNATNLRKMGVNIGSLGGITKIIKTETETAENSSRQSTYQNLLDFTDGVLQDCECGALMRIDPTDKNIYYDCYEGKDRSVDNTDGNIPVIFSQDFDNLLSADYTVDVTTLKNWALIGGEGEGLNRFYTYFAEDSSAGLDRREMFIDARSMPRSYEQGGTEHQYTDAEYQAMLKGRAQTDLKARILTESFEGEISLEFSAYKYGVDFWLGDIVTIQDNRLGLYVNVRIISATEIQDDSGYQLIINFEK